MNKKILCLTSALSANIIWGFMSIPLRLIKDYDPDQILYYRIFISLILSYLVVLLFNQKKLKVDLRHLKRIRSKRFNLLVLLIILSGILITLNWFAYIYVVNTINLKTAAFAYMICPLITALGGFLLLKEELSKLKIIALGVAVVSILLLATGVVNEVMWAMLTASFYAFFLIIQRKIQDIEKLNMLAFQLTVAVVLVLPLFLIYSQPFPLDGRFWVVMILISSVFTVLPLFLSLYALTALPSSTVGILIYINPVVAFSVAFFYFDEKIHLNQLFAYALLIFAVVLFNFKILKEAFSRKKSKEATAYIQP